MSQLGCVHSNSAKTFSLEEQHQAELDEEAKRHEQEFLELENQIEQERIGFKKQRQNYSEIIDEMKGKLNELTDDIQKKEGLNKVSIYQHFQFNYSHTICETRK